MFAVKQLSIQGLDTSYIIVKEGCALETSVTACHHIRIAQSEYALQIAKMPLTLCGQPIPSRAARLHNAAYLDVLG